MKDHIITDDLIEFVWECDPEVFRLLDGTVFKVARGDSLWGEELEDGQVRLHFHTKARQ